MNIEQTKAHYEYRISHQRDKILSIIKTIKNLADAADYKATAVIPQDNCSGIAQFAIQLQDAAAELRGLIALKVQLDEITLTETVKG